ncbi:vWA domain-containing protein [Phreatobacter sp.]|uniref:vWA domain-containing protein n=1 Tax=Phreatobacter sp. TaxID=1966341 RepID=UPI003F727162
MRTVLVAAGMALLSTLATPAIAQQASTLIIMDGSGSMWGRIGGRPKLEIARETVARVLATMPANRRLGLMAYGHRSRGDCADIELIVPPAAGGAAAIRDAVAAMRFQGRTPLTESLRQAAEALRSTEEPATVVLITDGIETCSADPCAMASDLKAAGVSFTAHVIGFGLTRREGAQVACIAANTGGRYIEARDAGALAGALAEVVAAAPAPSAGAPPAAAAAPPPAPEPETSRHFPGGEMMTDAALAPTGGTTSEPMPYPAERAFPPEGTIAQCRAQCDADSACGAWRYEPKGSHFVDHARCHMYNSSAEFDLGMMRPEDGWASGMKPGVRSLIRPYLPLGTSTFPVTLEVRGPVAPGAEITVLWAGPANARDWVDIVPAGHEGTDGALAHFDVNETIEPGDALQGAGTLTAPDQPGTYELRYVLAREIDRRVLHRIRVTVGPPR